MAMITCRECGKQISDTADICPHCGAKVNQITVKSSASSKHLIIYATLIILGAFVFFVGLGIFFDDINTYYPHYNYRSPLTSHESQVISTIVVGFALCMLGTYKTFKSMSFPKIGNGSHLSTSTVIPMNHDNPCCPSCGARNNLGSKFCSKCGAPMQNPASRYPFSDK